MRNKIIFILGRVSSVLGTQLYNFVFALMVLYTTGSAIDFAVTIVLETIPRILFGTISGILADRYNRKKILIYSDFLSGLILIIAFIVLNKMNSNIWIVFILTFILNSINTFFDVTMNSSLDNLFSDDGLETMCSINEGITSSISLLAPTIGAAIYAISDFKTFILLNGVSFFVSAFSEIFIEYPEHSDELYQKRTLIEEVKETRQFLKAEKVVFDLYFVAVFINVFYGISASLALPVILMRYVNISEIEYGIIETIVSVGMVVGAGIFSFIKTDKKYKLIIGSLMSESIAIIFIALPCIINLKENSFIIYCFVAAFLGLSVSSVNINVRVLMQRMIPDNIKGKVLGTLSSMCMSVGPIIIICGSFYIEKHNPSILVLLCGVSFIFMNILLSFDKEMQKV